MIDNKIVAKNHQKMGKNALFLKKSIHFLGKFAQKVFHIRVLFHYRVFHIRVYTVISSRRFFYVR